MSVRRPVLSVEKSIDQSTQWVVFEPNGTGVGWRGGRGPRKETKGLREKDGACNETVDIGLNVPGHCWRDDNGSGLCNVHKAAKARGARRRQEAADLHLKLHLARIRARKAARNDVAR